MDSLLCRALGILLVGVTLCGPATAQTAEKFSNEKLTAFAEAASQVDALIRQWRPRINGAATKEQAAKLRGDANAAFVSAIEKTKGITVDEYQRINKAARANPDLAARIASLYKRKDKPKP